MVWSIVMAVMMPVGIFLWGVFVIEARLEEIRDELKRIADRHSGETP